jgi:hypothetical protein
MAITTELLLNMVKRINEKLSSNIELFQNKGKFTLAGTPFPITLAGRTSAQMFEYLAGLEDAIDARPQRVYFIRCEVNDHGWHNGFHHFARLEDAIKLMRNRVARQILNARAENKKVLLKVFGDRVMGDVSKNPQRSQNIFVRIDDDTFEFRVWSEELHYSEVPKDKCFNY